VAEKALRQVRFAAGDNATDILLVRHGESAAASFDSEFPKYLGHGNPALHPHGRAQAERVADRLESENLAAIYTTPFDRTRDTAAPLLARLGMEARIEPELREVFMGDWESPIFRKYMIEGHPLADRIFAEERWDLAPGAESAEAFQSRVHGAIVRIAAAHPGETVAVFTHGGVIGRVLADAAQSRPFAFNGAANASISHLVVDGDRWTIRVYNDTAHLSTRFIGAPDLPWVDDDQMASEVGS
jgi:probable phosphoglycerate mutase